MENGSRSLGFYKRCSEILVLLYSNDNSNFFFFHFLKQTETYFNLIQTVVGLNETKNDSIKVAILYFIELLCEHCFQEDHLKLFANDLVLLFEKFIVDTNIDVRFWYHLFIFRLKLPLLSPLLLSFPALMMMTLLKTSLKFSPFCFKLLLKPSSKMKTPASPLFNPFLTLPKRTPP